VIKEELQDAIIRVFSLKAHVFSDSYSGVFILPDDIADAFRSRL